MSYALRLLALALLRSFQNILLHSSNAIDLKYENMYRKSAKEQVIFNYLHYRPELSFYRLKMFP